MAFLGLLFNSTIGRYLILAVILGGGFFIWLTMHDSAIKTQATLEFNNKQLEQTLKDMDKLNRDIQALNAIADGIVIMLKERREFLDAEADAIKKELEGIKGADNESSEVLKETLRRLDRLK